MTNMTLGDYRDAIVEAAGENNNAVKYFDRKIEASAKGRDEEVLASYSQMIMLVIELLAQENN